jgi:flagellar hook-length control protein FliK
MKTLAALLTPKQSAATEPTDFLSQLTERIQMQLRDGEDIIRIQLKPSSLGRMEIRAETSSAGVIATIVTESAGVKSYLEHNLHLLQESFQDQGLKVDRINVAVQDGDWSQHSGSGQQEPRSGTGNRGESKSTGWHSGLMEDSGEELALDPATQAALRPYSTFHAVA